MSRVQISPFDEETLRIFPSDLGWMAAVFHGEKLVRLSFGHTSAASARSVEGGLATTRKTQSCRKIAYAQARTRRLLQAFAAGRSKSLADVSVELGPLSDFQRRVLTACRGIPYGRTISYAELAARAGFPGTARAVGNCMAMNPIPLAIPCHRVVRSDGRLGAYSAAGGTAMKRRLLDMESRN